MIERGLRLLVLLGFFLAVPAGTARALEVTPVEMRPPVPDLSFVDMEGAPAKLSDFRGKVVVLNIWATWCQPCREEMPTLDNLQAIFADEPVIVLALSVDRSGPERVRAFLEEIGVERLHVYRDPKMAATRTLRVPGLPATLLIDRQGREAARHLGIAEWDSDEIQAILRGLLAEGPA